MAQPMKFHKALGPVSDEHYDILFFGWKISEGLSNDIEINRLKAYANWFKENYVDPHFEIEKKYVFPILGLKNVRVKRAMANHRRLIRLLNEPKDVNRALNRIEEEIGRYIRFEERILYKEIEKIATPQQLQDIEEYHKSVKMPREDWKDEFWIA
jgi:hypothetical protein